MRSILSRRYLIDEHNSCFLLDQPELQALLSRLSLGAWVMKYSISGRPLRRRMYLNANHDGVVYESTKKTVKETTMRLLDLEGLYRGQHTSVFFTAKSGKLCGQPADCCLSLVSFSGFPRKSLDVAFENEEIANEWHSGLSALLIAALVSMENSETRTIRRAFNNAIMEEAPSPCIPLSRSLSYLPPNLISQTPPTGGTLSHAVNGRTVHCGPRLWELLKQESRRNDDLCREPQLTSSTSEVTEHSTEPCISLPGLLRVANTVRTEERCDVAAIFYHLLDRQRLIKRGRESSVKVYNDEEDCVLSVDTILEFLKMEQGQVSATKEDSAFLCQCWSEYGQEHFRFLSFDQPPGDNASKQVHENHSSCGLFADNAPPPSMCLSSFVAWMASSFNSALSPAVNAAGWCDMSAPLADYWIASSHNTYLEGDQLLGPSSTAPYLLALSKGCRCVELDVWDGPLTWGGAGGRGEPVVTHGGTLTSRIPLRDVTRALSQYGFLVGEPPTATHRFPISASTAASSTPLILSLEMHCSVSQQKVVAEILRGCFGDRLATWESMMGLPIVSPAILSGKVLIKTKLKGLESLLDISSSKVSEVGSHELNGNDRGGESFEDVYKCSSEYAENDRIPGQSSSIDFNPSAVASMSSSSISPTSSSSSANLFSQSLLDLVYLRGVPWRSILLPGGMCVSESEGEGNKSMQGLASGSVAVSDAASRCTSSMISGVKIPPPPPPYLIASAKENNVLALLRKSKTMTHLLRVTRTNLVRVYPGRFRVSSSNFNPTLFWAMGVQMTALNYQTNDLPLRIQKAWFQQNGRSGFVLKPLYLRNDPASSGCQAPSPVVTQGQEQRKRQNPDEGTGEGGFSMCQTLQKSLRLKDWVSIMERLTGFQSLSKSTFVGTIDGIHCFPHSTTSDSTQFDVAASTANPNPASTAGSSAWCTQLLLPSVTQKLPSPLTFRITLLGVTNLPSISHPPVPVQWTFHIYGHPLDCSKTRMAPVIPTRTGTCMWGGLDPVSCKGPSQIQQQSVSSNTIPPSLFHHENRDGVSVAWGETLSFSLTHPALACLYIEVQEARDIGGGKLLGYAALPLPSARKGFRSLNMRSADGGKIEHCTLFLRLFL